VTTEHADDGPVLEVRGLTASYGEAVALRGVSLTLGRGEVVTLVGRNGAGKTTLFNLLTGFLRPTRGRIEVHGRDVTGLEPERIAHLGVARSFQITSLFDQLDLREHVQLALQGRAGGGMRFWRSHRVLDRHAPRVEELLDQVGLADLASVRAGALSYGR
jgi:branched-chain amino acid transport system ATP-binding protein